MDNADPQKLLELQIKIISSNEDNVFQLRRDFEGLYLHFSSNSHPDIQKHNIVDIPAYKIKASPTNKNGAILFFHGGCFSFGSTRDHLDLCGKLSSYSHCCVFSIDYRLAPENKFPKALEDCLISYLWLLKKGLKPSEIVLVGISSGATLALSLLLYLKENHFELPSGAVCMSPLVNMLFKGHSMVTNKGKDWVTSKSLFKLGKIYLKDQKIQSPLISPLYGNLNGLPPILIQSGSHELVVDDVITFHRKAKLSDVEVKFQLWKGMFHSFQMFSTHIVEAQRAVEDAGEYINEILNTD